MWSVTYDEAQRKEGNYLTVLVPHQGMHLSGRSGDGKLGRGKLCCWAAVIRI